VIEAAVRSVASRFHRKSPAFFVMLTFAPRRI